MKLLHFSDTHLGFSEYTRIDPKTGLNQREQDFYDAWNFVIDEILKIKPDVVVHSGDLFHTSRPSNRAIRIALEGIQKVSQAGIPLVLISGNHSTPRIRSTGSIFESIALFENVYAAYRGRYECFRIGDADFHCIPHCSLTEELEAAFESLHFNDAKYNVLVTHGAWCGEQTFSMGEFNEQRISDPEKTLDLKFDYIALGHYHRRLDVAPNAAYPGSLERTSFNEAGYTSGYLLVNLQRGEREYVPVPSRPMIKIPAIDCRELSLPDIFQRLEKDSAEIPEGALVSLSLQNIPSEVFLKLEMPQIDSRFSQVFFLEKQFSRWESKSASARITHIGSLEVEFEKYINSMNLEKVEKQKLIRLGAEYLL
jgi:exonuclease SbcD